MKNVLFFSLLFLVLWTCDAFAVLTSCIGTTTCPDQNGCQYLNVVGCATGKDTFYGSYAVRSCLTCGNGYELVAKSVLVPGCTRAVFYNDCEKSCIECPDCESEDWTSVSLLSFYEKKVDAVCNKTTCKCSKKIWYRCKKGYYGTANSMGPSGCSRCPSIGTGRPIGSESWLSLYASTPGAGNGYDITDCYAPSTNEYKDTYGIYNYTSDCYYTE